MKNEISQILNHLTGGEEVTRLRNWLLTVDSSDIRNIATAISQLSDAIHQTSLHNLESVGIYRFLLACLYFELNEYQSAIARLQIALQEVWGNPVNKSLIFWVLGLCYSNVGEFPEARRFLQDGIQILTTNSRHFSQHSDRERRMKQSAEQEIRQTLDRLFNEPLFRTVHPDPTGTFHDFPLQEPAGEEEKGISISLNFPISINNQNNPVNLVNPSQQDKNQPKRQDTNTDVSVNHFESSETYESRTDQSGYMILPSQPIYKQELRAGKSGVPELEIAPDRFVEVDEIRINGIFYKLHPIRSARRINPESTAKWGWMKVNGKSMRAMKAQVSIDDGDFVLIKFSSNAEEGDIVVAYREESQNNDKFAVVKRYKKSEGLLISETDQKGSEYAPIDMAKDNVQIHGIVYAVAKPVTK